MSGCGGKSEAPSCQLRDTLITNVTGVYLVLAVNKQILLSKFTLYSRESELHKVLY